MQTHQQSIPWKHSKGCQNGITLWVEELFVPVKGKGYTEAEGNVCHVFITISNGQPEDWKGYVAAKNTVQTCTTKFPFKAGSLPSEMDMAAAEATIILHAVKCRHTFQGWTTLSKLHSVNDISLCDHLKTPTFFPLKTLLPRNYASTTPLATLYAAMVSPLSNRDW